MSEDGQMSFTSTFEYMKVNFDFDKFVEFEAQKQKLNYDSFYNNQYVDAVFPIFDKK